MLKRVSDSMFEQSLELKREFLGNRHLRMHIDENEAERVLVYEYFDDNLLSLVKNNPNMSLEARQWISRELGYSLKEFHAKNWIHIGNIYIFLSTILAQTLILMRIFRCQA